MAAISPPLFDDLVWLAVDTPDLSMAASAVREFRCCTRTVKIGLAANTGSGPMLVRCLQDAGISRLVLDLRYFGDSKEIWDAVYEASQLPCVKAVTLQAFCGPDIIKTAVDAAQASATKRYRVTFPKIIITTLPYTITDDVMAYSLQMSVGRTEYILNTIREASRSGASGVFVDYRDLRTIGNKVPGISLLANAEKLNDPTTINLDKQHPTVADVLKAGAAHAVVDIALAGRRRLDWAADLLYNEMKINKYL